MSLRLMNLTSPAPAPPALTAEWCLPYHLDVRDAGCARSASSGSSSLLMLYDIPDLAPRGVSEVWCYGNVNTI